MSKQRLRSLRIMLTLAATLAVLPAIAQNLERVAPKSAEGISRTLDKQLLPEGASDMEVERSQVVAADGVTIVPVRFRAEDKSGGPSVLGDHSRKKFFCGLYQLMDGAPTRFLVTFGSGQTEAEECSGLQAIGAAEPRARQGNLILIYAAATLHDSIHEPVILSWNEMQKQYVVNDDLTQFVSASTKKSYTVYGIRRLLASRDR